MSATPADQYLNRFAKKVLDDTDPTERLDNGVGITPMQGPVSRRVFNLPVFC